MSDYYPFSKRAEHDFLKDLVTAIVKIEKALNELRADEKGILRGKIEGLKMIVNKYYSKSSTQERKDDSSS